MTFYTTYVEATATINVPDSSSTSLSLDNSNLRQIINNFYDNPSQSGFRATNLSRYGFGHMAKGNVLLPAGATTADDLFSGGRNLFEFEIFPHAIVDTSGPHTKWIIDDSPYLKVTIEEGSNPFNIDDKFYFFVKPVPTSVTNSLKVH